jgi:hypothetical protein
MKRLSEISNALTQRLAEDTGILQFGATVEQAEFVNTTPQYAARGWIGVYDARKVYDPRTLGRHSTAWQGTVTLNVVVQYADYKDGRSARDGLEELLELVETVLTDGVTLGGTVDRVTGLEVDYAFRREEAGTVYYREAVVAVEAEVATG